MPAVGKRVDFRTETFKTTLFDWSDGLDIFPALLHSAVDIEVNLNGQLSNFIQNFALDHLRNDLKSYSNPIEFKIEFLMKF